MKFLVFVTSTLGLSLSNCRVDTESKTKGLVGDENRVVEYVYDKHDSMNLMKLVYDFKNKRSLNEFSPANSKVNKYMNEIAMEILQASYETSDNKNYHDFVKTHYKTKLERYAEDHNYMALIGYIRPGAVKTSLMNTTGIKSTAVPYEAIENENLFLKLSDQRDYIIPKWEKRTDSSYYSVYKAFYAWNNMPDYGFVRKYKNAATFLFSKECWRNAAATHFKKQGENENPERRNLRLAMVAEVAKRAFIVEYETLASQTEMNSRTVYVSGGNSSVGGSTAAYSSYASCDY